MPVYWTPSNRLVQAPLNSEMTEHVISRLIATLRSRGNSCLAGSISKVVYALIHWATKINQGARRKESSWDATTEISKSGGSVKRQYAAGSLWWRGCVTNFLWPTARLASGILAQGNPPLTQRMVERMEGLNGVFGRDSSQGLRI